RNRRPDVGRRDCHGPTGRAGLVAGQPRGAGDGGLKSDASWPSLVFSQCEDVHSAKRQWIIGFKDFPIIEVHVRGVAGKKCLKFLEDRWFNLEPLKRKTVLVQKRLD